MKQSLSELPRSIDLDFLRGLFILGILAYHLCPNFPLGIGQGSMESFFCLSGYLITKTLLRRLFLGWSGIRDFAINRLKRLMPTLVLFLLFVSPLNLIFERERIEIILKTSIFSILGFYNYFEIAQRRDLPFTSRIWSLSVEDQYYFILIILAWFIIFYQKENEALKIFFIVYVLFIIFSFAARLYYVSFKYNFSLSHISYLTLPRLWGFAWGGLAALACTKRRNYKIKQAIFYICKLKPSIWLCLAYVAMISVQKYEANAFLSGWLICPIFIAATILTLEAREQQGRLLASGTFFCWVAQIGVACYPIYLFQLSEKILNFNIFWLYSILLSIVIGLTIHHYFEKRFYYFPSYIK